MSKKGSNRQKQETSGNTGGFMDKLKDWKEFERFISELYLDDPNVKVERNKIEVDKNGARREIDIKLTSSLKMHKYVTLIECKRWKKKVTRDRVDVMFASLQGLNAQKGVIFTTKGYEPGAKKFAEGNNIDIFLVREMTPQEWGLPGRTLHVYNHFWSGEFERVQPGGVFAPHPGVSGKVVISLDVIFRKNKPLNPNLILRAADGRSGPNLASVLKAAHTEILNFLSTDAGRLYNGGKDILIEMFVGGKIDFSGVKHRILKQPDGDFVLECIGYNFKAHLNQSELRIDRGANIEIAVAVENYITKARHVAMKGTKTDLSQLEELTDAAIEPGQKPLENGQIFAIILEPYIGLGNSKPGGMGVLPKHLNLKVVEGNNSDFAFERTLVDLGIPLPTRPSA